MECLKNGVTVLESKSQKRVFMGCRKRKSMILPDSPDKGLLPKHLLDLRAGYNPNRHIRRRELTELVDTLTCEACGIKFKTIILLERHVKNCTNKEKFKNVHPLACPIMDESLARIKNICFYCNKNFTYAKSLINHFQDFCPVKKSRVDKGFVTDEDKLREEKIIDRVKKLEEEKLVKDPDHVKKKITWQVGRKPKRKGHSWTYIKKKKQLSESVENGVDEESVNSDKDEADVDKIDNDTEKDNVGVDDNNFCKDKDEVTTPTDNVGVTGENSTDMDHKNLTETMSTSVSTVTTCEAEVDEHVESDQKSVESDQTFNSFDEVDSASEVSEKHTTNDSPVINTLEEVKVMNEASFEPEMEDSPGPVKETNINDTSLNCTSRYQVNKVIQPDQKSKGTLDPSSKPSFIFKCMSKTIDESDTSPAPYRRCDPVPEKKVEDTNNLIMRSKRKRERVSKVEEFLRNAFRRKRSGKNGKAGEASKTEEDISDRISDANDEPRVRNESEKTDVEYQTDAQPYSESNSQQDNSSISSSSVDADEASNEYTDSFNIPTLPLTEYQPRKKGRPRKESAGNDHKVGAVAPSGDHPRKRGRPRKDAPVAPPKPSTHIPGKPGRPPTLYIPGKIGRPPKLKSRREAIAENIDAENQNGDENEEVTDSCKTEPSLDQVNCATVDYENISKEMDRVEHNLMESSNNLIEGKSEADNHKVNNNDSDTDQNSQNSTEKSEIENDIESEYQKGDQFPKMSKSDEIFEGKDKIDETDIKTEDIGFQIKQDEMAELSLDQNSEPNIFTVEKKELEECVLVCPKEENALIVNSASKQSTGEEVIPNKTKEHEHGTLHESAGRVNSSKEDNISSVNIVNDSVNFSSEQKRKKGLTVEETNLEVAEIETLPEPKEETGQNECQVMCNNIAEPETCEIEHVKDQKVSESSVNNDCDLDVNKFPDEEDRNLTETANAADKSENNEKPDTAMPNSPEPLVHEKYEMVLSPSERVKMNRRSCMKERDPFTPVWVRKPYKPKLKSPERKTTSETRVSDDCKDVSSTSKQSAAIETKAPEEINPPVTTQNSVDKKPVFKNRQEAINANLKLLQKQVTLKFAESLKARESMIAGAGVLVNKMSSEKVGSNLGIKNSPSRGIKRKPGERRVKDDIEKNTVKRRAVSSKIEKGEQSLSSPKPVRVTPKEQPKERDTAKDQKITKAKSVKR